MLSCPFLNPDYQNAILKFIFREEYIVLRLQKNHLSIFGLTKISFEAILFWSVYWIARTWGLSWMFVTAAIGSEHWRPLQCAYALWGQRFIWVRQREREQNELGKHWNTETVVKLATGAQVQPLRPWNLSSNAECRQHFLSLHTVVRMSDSQGKGCKHRY